VTKPALSRGMFTATLLCDPAKPCLDAALPQSLRNAWGGGDIVWLNPDIACEFSLSQKPENLWQVWQDVQELGVDLVVQPSINRRKKMLIADMDSTMIQQECIDELADVAGVGDHVKTMKKSGAFAALVSGGFTAFTSHIAQTLGFDENRANTLLVEGGKLTGEVGDPILGQQAKVDALEHYTAQLGLSAADVIAVGDGANDLGMLHRAGTGVALHAKPSVAAQCEVRVNLGDLTALLYIQGYMISDFAL